jgi:hypothetical protein
MRQDLTTCGEGGSPLRGGGKTEPTPGKLNRRYLNQAKEQPGISPAIVSRLLDTTIFLSLKDLNLALPSYKEEVVTLEMLEDQEQQYQSMDSSLKQLAIQSGRYLSTWLQWSLARPNSAFRDEVVMVDEVEGEDGCSVRAVPFIELPAINPNGHKWLPKEDWLASFCKAEKQQGRKVLVYVRQTGTRDIQDRVQLPLQAGGLRAPDPEGMPPCPICGGRTYRDRTWDGKYTRTLGWRRADGF